MHNCNLYFSIHHYVRLMMKILTPTAEIICCNDDGREIVSSAGVYCILLLGMKEVT